MDLKEIFVLQIRIITAVGIYSVVIKIPKFMVFLSFEFMELYLSSNFILKVRLYLNEGMTFDIQTVITNYIK